MGCFQSVQQDAATALKVSVPLPTSLSEFLLLSLTNQLKCINYLFEIAHPPSSFQKGGADFAGADDAANPTLNSPYTIKFDDAGLPDLKIISVKRELGLLKKALNRTVSV